MVDVDKIYSLDFGKLWKIEVYPKLNQSQSEIKLFVMGNTSMEIMNLRSFA
jgi:hypothetical protein